MVQGALGFCMGITVVEAGLEGTGGDGAGISGKGPIVALNSTLSGNSCGQGGSPGYGGPGGWGAFRNGSYGSMGTGGSGGSGGGIWSSSTLELTHCTIVGNRTGAPATGGAAGRNGGGIFASTGLLQPRMANTVVALNEKAGGMDDVAGMFSSLGGNLIGFIGGGDQGFSQGKGDLLNVPPLLTPLGHNGGPTLTHALWPESPAVNAGTNLTTATNDQRGFSRVACARTDAGAYEFEGCPLGQHPAAAKALYFDGTKQGISGVRVALSNSFTVEAWAKRDRIGTADCIVSLGVNNLVFGFQTNNLFTFSFSSKSLNTATNYTDSEWHHWAGVFDTNGPVTRIYMDGVLVASTNMPPTFGAADSLRIGMDSAGGSLFNGELDEIRVWKVACTPSEITANATRALTGTESNLVAYYRFDEGAGSRTKDAVSGLDAPLDGRQMFVNSGAPLFQPIVTTLPAVSVRSTSAILRGMVNPAGTNSPAVWVEYGTSRYLGNASPVTTLNSGVEPQEVAFPIENLESGTKYYYRIVAGNIAGTVQGETASFDTLVVGNGYPISTRANTGQSASFPRHATDSEGNVYLTGLFTGSIQLAETLQARESQTNGFLAKSARKGDWRWGVGIPISSGGWMRINSVAVEGPDSVLVAGSFSGSVLFGSNQLSAPQGSRAFVARYEHSLTNWTWSAALGGGTNNHANAVSVGSDGAIYIAGEFSGTTPFGTNATDGALVSLAASGGSDAFVARYSRSGLVDWVSAFGGSQSTREMAQAMAAGPFGELYIVGSFAGQGSFGMESLTSRSGSSDFFFAAINMTNGTVRRAIAAGGQDSDIGTAVAVHPEGNIYVAAQFSGAATFDGAPLPELDSSGMNMVVAQLSRQGVLSRRVAARGARGQSLAISSDGRVYVAGDFTGVMQYGPSLITIGTGTNASSDIFLSELKESMETLSWTGFRQLGGIGTETCGTITTDRAGSVVLSGTYAQSMHVGYVELSTPNSSEVFVARMEPDGVYEHNLWEIGKALDPPVEALEPGQENRAIGLLSIEIMKTAPGLEDSDGGNAFLWNTDKKRLYAIRPVTARIKWRLDQNLTNMANVATIVGRCYWPEHPRTNVAGAPVEVQGPGVGKGYFCAGISFNTNGADISPVTRGAQQFQVFQTPTNSSGYNVIHYMTEQARGESVFDVVLTKPYGTWATSEPATVGQALGRAGHQDTTGKNGYVLFDRSFYDAVAHERAARSGPILPVNRNLHSDPHLDMVVVWYRTNEVTGIAWGSDPVRYEVGWPVAPEQIVIASGLGQQAGREQYPQVHVYHQPAREAAGFNPNEEHALIVADRLYALRCDLNAGIIPKASEPYVLLKYCGPDSTNDWRMKVFEVVAENEQHTFAKFGSGQAGLEVQMPAPLNMLGLCVASNRVAFGQQHAHQAWTGKIYAKSAGYFQVQYWYPAMPDFYFGGQNPPENSFVPWMSGHTQAPATPGASHVIGEPVLVGYDIEWPPQPAMLFSSDSLTTSKNGLPDLFNFASAEVIYDAADPHGTNIADAMVRIFDPISERTIQMPADFELPEVIRKSSDRGRFVFPDLPYALRIRLLYDELNQRLSFAGWYDQDFGTGEPLLLPNVLSPRERDRIKQLDGTNAVSLFDRQVDRLYNLTRNPNGVDVDRNGQADTELRVGLITQIRDGFEEILAGPVIPGPSNTLVTYRTNRLAQPVSSRMTNVVQEQFGPLPKALTAGLKPGSGFITVVENDDPQLPGQPINLHVIYVTNRLYRGDLKVLQSDNVFDERLTLRHSGDFAGEPQNYEFEWYYQPDQNGLSPEFPALSAGQTNWNGWIRFPSFPAGKANCYNEITLGEGNDLSTLLVLSDNWVLCRYRGFTNSMPTEWSDWVGAPGGEGAMLAQGWIKRVMGGLNEFDARVKDFHQGPTATYASMILQAGKRYEGPIAFNPDPNYLNELGLIQSYETVLDRGRKLSIDGLPAVNFGPANNALLRAAGKIADLYTLLGNEAYADASDPTIGFTTSSGEYGNLAPSIFCFQNQLDSPIEEELALLRGRDDSAMGVRAQPIYNRLLWNFTQGEGEIAYKLTYNISDQNHDGALDESDARILIPQGHGDAWGHYLTASKKYYSLLRHPNYEWVPRPEAVTVAGSPVQVDYLDERKFARVAAAKAKAGGEIVNLTYRQKYVENPAGQWQGYKDTETDRAWGVDEWARRAGTAAYFDWVVANAILPSIDPDTNHAGIQKIDRTTVTELDEVSAQFTAIEAQLDMADRGLNPLGLASGAMPFDIDPSKVASGKTHFDQLYDRALKAMENSLVLFDHVNSLSQSLRRNQDEVDEFSSNVTDQERSYKNRMIEIFGYPYPGDIGPAGTYPSGYDGPDIYHYMYVNASELTGSKTQPDVVIPNYYKPMQFPDADSIFFPDDIAAATAPVLSTNKIFQVNYPMVKNGIYEFEAPSGWGNRRAPGKIQNALSEMLKARAQLNHGLVAYDNLRRDLLDQIEILSARSDLASSILQTRVGNGITAVALDTIRFVTAKAKKAAENAGEAAKDTTEASVEAMPKSVGLATDVTAPARGTLRIIGSAIWQGMKYAAAVLSAAENQAKQSKETLKSETDLKIVSFQQDYEIQKQIQAVEQLCREEAARRIELYTLQENLQQALGSYQSALAEGQRALDERFDFRVKTAAKVQQLRYQDMGFRIFQNDALQKYRAQFDVAARYVYLATKAYDYETCLLNTESGAGSRMISDIVRQRTLGQVVAGFPVSGRHGLADPLARLGQNFEVYRGQLGFTTPETETGRFSLRTELFRVRPGALHTNLLNGLVSTNQDWRALLQKCRVPDLWKVPEFRRFCRAFAPESAGPQPGIVIRIPTTITFGLNYFGWPLGPGDSAYDSSRFATKVRSAGVWFSGYNISGLSMTPRVYLVPAGVDILRSPSGDDLQIREFNVVDQKLPVPFPIGATDLSNPSWIPANDSLSETFGDIRRFSSFRAYHDSGWFDPSEATQDTRLIGRSVWNTEWMLIIPGGTFLYDPDRGLDTFIATVGDIKIFFQTYSYSGN